MSKNFDIYQHITDKIIAKLETVDSAWQMPWHQIGAGQPINVKSRKPYRGINVPMLWMDSDEKGFTSNEWGTFNQWKEKGASVRKGESSSMIVFYKMWKGTRDNEETGEKEKFEYPMIRYSRVFNAEQVDGYETKAVEAPESDAVRLSHADQYIGNTGAKIEHNGDRAFYSPKFDSIKVPKVEQFKTTDGYYGTVLHELTHWTAHKSRCDRDLRGRFGDELYAAEELVAELGAAFLCNTLSITAEPRDDHAKYLKSWLKVLKNDKKAIVTAASKAQKAVDYLDSLQAEQEQAA